MRGTQKQEPADKTGSRILPGAMVASGEVTARQESGCVPERDQGLVCVREGLDSWCRATQDWFNLAVDGSEQGCGVHKNLISRKGFKLGQ